MNSEDSPSTPLVILELTWPGPEATEVPMFAAINLTATLLEKLETHSSLCRQYSLNAIEAQFPEPDVWWDVRDGTPLAELADVETVWRSTSGDHAVYLRGRRPQPGGSYGPVAEIAVSSIIDHAEFQTWRNTECVIEFREYDWEADAASDDPFALRAYRRLLELNRYQVDMRKMVFP